MGKNGPVPKRSNQRRRRNKPEVEVDRAEGAEVVDIPEAGAWHPAALAWYDGLAKSGQSQFYEPSDWATAWVLAESMSRELLPQPIVTKEGAVIEVERPISGSAMAALLKGMSVLLVTEGDRRRARLELQRAGPAQGEEPADVSELAEYRRRAQSGG